MTDADYRDVRGPSIQIYAEGKIIKLVVLENGEAVCVLSLTPQGANNIASALISHADHANAHIASGGDA